MATGETTEHFTRRCRHCGVELSPSSSFCSKCGATAELPGVASDDLRDRLQQLFGADLEFERELGRGGMGAVFSAFDPVLQRRVAVKALLPEVASDRGMAERFLGEARTVAALQHPHVVTVYVVRSGNGVHAIVMEFIEGRSLDAILRDRGQLPVPLAGMLLSHAAAGLQHAHDRGVIHRDVKPANVLIDHDGRAIVSDFGIARRESSPRLTDTGLVFGTWAYMSPEQRTGDTLTSAMTSPPPSLRSIRADVPAALENLINRMLAKNPNERWPSLKEAERTFGTLVPDEGQTTLQLASYSKVVGQSAGASVIAAARRPPTGFVGAAPTQRLSTAEQSTLSASTPPVVLPTKSRGVAMIAAAVVLVVGGIGAWLALSRGGAGRTTAAASAPSSAAAQVTANSPGAPSNTAGNERTNAPGGAGSTGGVATASGTMPTSREAVSAPPAEAATTSSAKSEPVAASALPGAATAPPTAAPSATLVDARKLGREFVTLLNQRRYRELGQLQSLGGDAAVRVELIKLTESAVDFAVGFDRVPAAPTLTATGFETEFYLDIEWRGGKKSMRVRLYAVPADGGWRAVGFAADPG
jgi:hypothetical protein